MENWIQAKEKQEEAVLAILERTEKSIYAAIHKYARKPYDTEECYAEGVLLVLECIESYDADTGVPFLAYVHTRLKYHFLHSWNERQMVSLDAAADENGLRLLDLLCADEDTEAEILAKEEREALHGALAGLTERERKCVEGYYFHGLSLSEIAHSLGIAYRTAYNNKTRGLNKLRKRLTDDAEAYEQKGASQ